ncbi:Apolipoprotein L1 [Manis pentadactyla]|nr:Apolipoprotein L1 [Manis pentadactyla]
MLKTCFPVRGASGVSLCLPSSGVYGHVHAHVPNAEQMLFRHMPWKNSEGMPQRLPVTTAGGDTDWKTGALSPLFSIFEDC